MNEVSRELMCIFIRGGVELWVEKEKIGAIQEQIKRGVLFTIEGNMINANDIIGIFKPEVIADRTRRRNGQHQCEYGKWHERFKKCECKVEGMGGEELAKFSRGF